ncbi:MAG: exodeoxyribonuclease III [Candidatus Kapaibacterium sp.]
MKIVTWNINGIRSVIGQTKSTRRGKVTQENRLFEYIDDEKPDILCLQETKATLDQIDEDLRYPPGYEGYYHSSRSKKGYSGVVTYSKNKAEEVIFELGIERFDREGRLCETDFGDFVLLNVYFPKGYAEQERLQYKLGFYDALFDHAEKHRNNGREIIISGDYNTAHKEIDLARPKENQATSGFLPEEREKFDEILDRGYIDAFREFIDEGGHYTWWSQRGRARENNVGWRIDYHLVTKGIAGKMKDCYIRPDVMGSDHCPVVLELDL